MLFPTDAKYRDLHEDVVLLFREAQLEIVHCPLCGDYHPPDTHLNPTTPFESFDEGA